MKNHFSALLLAVLHISCIQATTIASKEVPKQAIPEHNAALRKHLPNLYNALRSQGSTSAHLVEFLERIAQEHQTATTWHLAQNSHHFIGDLLHMLDTIVAEQGVSKEKRYTCALSGNSGTLPMLLLTAGLYRIGIHDVELQIIGNESKTALKQLNQTIRKTMLGRANRFHLHQVKSVDAFIKTSACHVRKPNTIITTAGSNQAALTHHLINHKHLVFNLDNHTRS